MIERITSKQNQLLQQVKRLQTSRGARYESGLFVAEGTKLYAEAAAWHSEIETVIVSDGIAVDVPHGVRHVTVPPALMKSISAQEKPQGVMFLCRIPEKEPLTMSPGSLILDGIQDPGNLGTILRTADALDVPVVLSDGCADPYSDKTVRASMGAVFRTKPQQASKEEILACCRHNEIPIAVTALSDRASDIREADLGRVVTVIGSEGRGVCDAYLRAAKQELVIPMNPRCESLNAAVAATIVMWQMKR